MEMALFARICLTSKKTHVPEPKLRFKKIRLGRAHLQPSTGDTEIRPPRLMAGQHNLVGQVQAKERQYIKKADRKVAP